MKKGPVVITDDVVRLIQEELSYQDSMAGTDRANTGDNGVAGQLVILERYTRKAVDAWTDNAGDENALHELRKVAAIAIRALVCYGCPRR